MKISPCCYVQNANFKSKQNITSESFGKDGDLTNAGAYGLTCLLTAVPGVQFVKKGFKEANLLNRIGKLGGGLAITLGLAVPLFAIFKSLKKVFIICKTSYNYVNIKQVQNQR